MLYITAIPDDYYFTWQLEVQLLNFQSLGIPKGSIHVLIGYDTKKGLQHYFSALIEDQKEHATFFVYADNRKQREYASSIRPYLFQQHIKAIPSIAEESIFYYDTDLIMRELPDFTSLLQNDTWYVSDTRNYLNSRYVINAGGNGLFEKMCHLVGITPGLVKDNDQNCGGAQYLIKKAPLSFWEKVEKDCEALYVLMRSRNNIMAEELYISQGSKRSECQGIQGWCADMWAVFWNALFFGYHVEISRELDFCWTTEVIESWKHKKILHYSGAIEENDLRLFRKVNYPLHSPYYDSKLSRIDQNYCGSPIAALVNQYRQKLDEARIDLSDLTFVFQVEDDSDVLFEDLSIIFRYLAKYFVTNILVCHPAEMNLRNWFAENNYYFFTFIEFSSSPDAIQQITTPYIALSDTHSIIPAQQIITAVNMLRSSELDHVVPFKEASRKIDSLAKEMFAKLLDDSFFGMNINKFLENDILPKSLFFCGRQDVILGKGLLNTDKYTRIDGTVYTFSSE